MGPNYKRITTNVLQEMKNNGEKISMLTANDYTLAKIVDNAGIDVILVGDSEFMSDQGGGRSPENHIFIMNSVDFLVGDRDLISLRSRQITSRPLEEVSDGAKRTWKWVNIITPSLLIIGFGLIRIRNQKNRSSVLEELYG